MTFIKPRRQNPAILGALVALVIAVIASGLAVIVLYNRLVNAEHARAQLAADIQAARVASAELHEEIFSLLAGSALDDLVASRGLVLEKSPRYLPSASGENPWLASR